MAQVPFDSRSAQRVAVACPVIFGGAPFFGEGALRNLSRTGCSIACNRIMLTGSYIRLAMLLPDTRGSVLVEWGKVRWAHGKDCGVEFLCAPTLADQPVDHMTWERLTNRLSSIGPSLV